MELPESFNVPDPSAWERGHAEAARRAKGLHANTLDQALAAVTPFLDPLLQHQARGHWSPSAASWEP